MNILNSNLDFGALNLTNNPREIIIHHAEASNCSVEDIHAWHKNNGWAGIGYHYFVRKDGSIYKGRPDNAIGAHCLGNNTNTLGVCFEGAYNNEIMPTEQLNAGRELIAYLKNEYLITEVGKHKDYMSTDCPGNNFPFSELVNGLSNNVQVSIQYSAQDRVQDNWIARLQEECNNQGFSSQVVDGLPGPITLNGCPLLKEGAQGNITRLLQEKLRIITDGIFGPNTREAVLAFQINNGLVADGIVGKNTWRALLGL